MGAQYRYNLAFLAIEPVREAQLAFSEPYVLIEGTYLVDRDAPFQRVAELDQAGLRLAVGKGAAYDLYLSRTLEHAKLVRADTSAGAVDLFIDQAWMRLPVFVSPCKKQLMRIRAIALWMAHLQPFGKRWLYPWTRA